MEKRILLAFVLSFLVLSLWTTINPPPKKTSLEYSQINANKELTSEKPPLSSLPVHVAEALPSQNEEISILENDKIKIEFSNIGGTIKNIIFKEFNVTLPITKIFNFSQVDKVAYSVNINSKNEIIYSYRSGNIKIAKSYVLSDNDYQIQANVQTENLSNLTIDGFTVDSSKVDPKILQSPDRSLYEYSIGFLNQVIRKGGAIQFNSKDNKTQDGEVTWLGYRDRYFAFILKPKFKTSRALILTNDKNIATLSMAPQDSNINTYAAIIYAGPQKLHLLSSYNQGFENIMVFSNWGILDIFAKMIYFFVHFLQGMIKSWGVAILILAFTIYAVTYPLTAKSMSSMRKMQALQPKMKSLQDKYKDNPQKLNQEMMELYKENKVNPFGGCLPMLLQMPIFYGLYQVLWRSVEFKGTPFLWIKDLSMPDRLAMLSFNLPFLGNELNILPILMAVIMFFQQRFTSRSMVITDENQLMQQKMMAVMMPIMMGVIFYHFASGLCIYFTVFYLLSTLAQWRMSKVNPLAK